jgi:hypothetical protein
MNANRIVPLRSREPRTEAQFANDFHDHFRSESVGAEWEPIESVESAHPWLWLSYVCAFVAVIAGSAVFQW